MLLSLYFDNTRTLKGVGHPPYYEADFWIQFWEVSELGPSELLRIRSRYHLATLTILDSGIVSLRAS
jgi:hypothetical protein